MEFEKQLNRIKKGQVSLVYLVQGKEPYLQELARKVFLDTIVAPEDQDLNVGRFNMDEVSVQPRFKMPNLCHFWRPQISHD